MPVELNIDEMSSNTSTPINRFKVTEGTHVLRILPPFGTDHRNRASHEINLHWGFTTAAGQVRPISCSYPTEKYCPICTRAKELEALAERAKAEGDADSEKENRDQSIKLRSRRSFLYNAADKNGKVGVLDVPKSLHDEIIKLFKEYVQKFDLDPTSLTDGVWLQLSREGQGLKTRYAAKFNKTTAKIDGELVEKLDRTPLSDSVVNNYEKLAVDIHSLHRPSTALELKKVLDGAPVDEVFKRQPKPNTPKAEASAVTAEVKVEPKVEAKAEVKPQPAPVTKASSVAPVDNDWSDILND
jgi:hypothetical protein